MARSCSRFSSSQISWERAFCNPSPNRCVSILSAPFLAGMPKTKRDQGFSLTSLRFQNTQYRISHVKTSCLCRNPPLPCKKKGDGPNPSLFAHRIPLIYHRTILSVLSSAPRKMRRISSIIFSCSFCIYSPPYRTFVRFLFRVYHFIFVISISFHKFLVSFLKRKLCLILAEFLPHKVSMCPQAHSGRRRRCKYRWRGQ